MSKAITIHAAEYPAFIIQPIEAAEAAAAMTRLQETGTLFVTSAGFTHYFGSDTMASAFVLLSDASIPGNGGPG